MKHFSRLAVLAVALFTVAACNDSAPVGKPLAPPMKDRSPEEQIKAIESSPLPPEAREREIARIRAEAAGKKGTP